jgi:hypothetical protein
MLKHSGKINFTGWGSSPFGRGIRFFTLLILFYLAYPGLRRIPQQYSKVFMLFFIFAAARMRINETLYRYASIFTPCVLEIYLLHGYFSLRPTVNHIINFSISFVIVLSLSIMLNRFSKVLTR